MRSTLLAALALGAVGLNAGCHSVPSTPIDELATEAGLHRAGPTRLDAVYVNPNTAFAAYKKVMLQPVVASFRAHWKPERPGTQFRLTGAEMNAVKQHFEATFMEAFADELQHQGYEVVSTPGPGVLEIRARVSDLFIPAVDPSRYSLTTTRTFVRDGSEMTLTAEVRDSMSGEILSRAYDRQRTTTNPRFDEVNFLTNEMDARRIISTWASQLHTAFGASRT